MIRYFRSAAAFLDFHSAHTTEVDRRVFPKHYNQTNAVVENLIVWIFIQNHDSNFPFPVEWQLLSFQTFVRKFDSAAFWLREDFRDFLDFYSFNVCPFYLSSLSTPLLASFSIADKEKKFVSGPFLFALSLFSRSQGSLMKTNLLVSL